MTGPTRHVSRRRFVALTAAGAAAPFAMLAAGPTAQAIVDRVKARIGVPWIDDTSDTWLAGHPLTSVTGIVTTSMATLEVLRQAVPTSSSPPRRPSMRARMGPRRLPTTRCAPASARSSSSTGS